LKSSEQFHLITYKFHFMTDKISFNAGSHTVIPLLQSFTVIHGVTQGRRASLCSALAPGYHIARLWRCAI
jgi:hypothetical protein